MRNIAQPCAICQGNLLFALDKEFLTARLRVAIAFDAMQNASPENKFRATRRFRNSKYSMTINRLCEEKIWIAGRGARTRA
jgi:hypothetical protein